MNNLLKVSCKRLFKDKALWLAIGVTLVLSLGVSLTNAPEVLEWKKAGDDVGLEHFYYNLAPILGLVFAAVTSLFLGTEYSDGTLRNKLIAGHSRSSVFLSMFMASALGCIFITAVFLIGGLPGLYYFKGFDFGWDGYALTAIALVCSAMLFASIFTATSLLISNKAVSAVASLIIWFALLFAGSSLVNLLAAKPTTVDYALVNGEWVAGEPYPNPAYIGGIKRTILEAINHIIPTCPAIKMSNAEYDTPLIDIAYSLGATLVILLGGCFAFKKKDLK